MDPEPAMDVWDKERDQGVKVGRRTESGRVECAVYPRWEKCVHVSHRGETKGRGVLSACRGRECGRGRGVVGSLGTGEEPGGPRGSVGPEDTGLTRSRTVWCRDGTWTDAGVAPGRGSK